MFAGANKSGPGTPSNSDNFPAGPSEEAPKGLRLILLNRNSYNESPSSPRTPMTPLNCSASSLWRRVKTNIIKQNPEL